MIDAQVETAVPHRSRDWWRVEARALPAARWSVLLSFVLVAAGYVAAQYLLLPGNTPFFFPFMYDDYLALAYGLPAGFLLETRPVYRLAVALVSTWGIDAFYLTLTVLSILNAWLVLRFVFWVCRRPLPLFWSLIFALITFSASTYVWAGKYNLFPNHLSLLFGVLSMFALVAGATKPSATLSLLGVGLFALSIFAKEDYFLAIVCVAVYCLINGGRASWRRNGLVLAGLAVVVALFLWHTLFVAVLSHVKFGADANDPYAQHFGIASMAATFGTYLGSYSLPSVFLLALFGAAVLYAAVIARRLDYYLVLAIIAAAIAPYTVLPGHITAYDAFNWIPWMVAFGLVVLPPALPTPREVTAWMQQRRGALLARDGLPAQPAGRANVAGALGLTLLLALAAAGALAQTQAARETELAFFMKMSMVNRNIVAGLMAHREELASHDLVGIVGADRWSPWLRTQAEYLTTLGLENHWLIFVVPNDFYHKQLATNPYDLPVVSYDGARVTYLRLADLKSYPDLPLLVFDDDGHVLSWGTDAGAFFRQCIDDSETAIIRKCRTNRNS